MISNKLYDVLKWLVLIVIPALTTFYAVLDNIFGWGYAETVTTISAAACTCIGAIIGISTAQYNKEIR
jgi:ABC-type Na+ efflux pump permease subunit